jgi:hypothetical protein
MSVHIAQTTLVRSKVARWNLASCTAAAKKGRDIGATEPASIADFFRDDVNCPEGNLKRQLYCTTSIQENK